MSVKISELPILSSLADNDIVAGVDVSGNVTSKIEMATLKNYIDTNTQYTAGTNIDITNNVVSAPNVYNKTETDELLEEKDEQIEELQSEVDSLSTIFNVFPTESGEGESFTLDDTAEVKFKKFDLKGNTSQTGTPTPSSPIPVNVVSGDNEINVVGKNLFGEEEHGAIDEQTGVDVYNANRWRTIGYLNVTPNTQYTLSSNANSNIYYIFYYYDSSKTFISSQPVVGKESVTKTTPNNCYYMRCVIADTTSIKTTQRQLEVGPSATTYEPYQGNTYNIDLGMKNLWNSEDMESGYLNQSGSYPVTNSSYPNARYIIVPLYKGQSLTTYSQYTYSAFRMRYIDIETNQIVGTVGVGTNNGYCTSAVTYQGAWSNGTVTATKDILLGLFDFDGIMSTSGSYKITYGTKIQTINDNPIELCKIGNYQDYFYKDSGKWYLHKEIGKVVLDGSEGGGTIYDDGQRFGYTSNNVTEIANALINTPTSVSNVTPIYSDHFTGSSQSGVTPTSNTIGFSQWGTTKYIYLSAIESTVANYKTWLSNNNVKVYFPLATPTNTEITYQPLIDQLNELEKAMSKDSQTNISQVNNDLGFIIYAEAIKSLENVLDRLALVEE